MYLTSEGRRLAGRLLDRPRSGMGQRALEYTALVPDPPYCGLIPIPPHQYPGLEINTTIPRIRSKKHTPWSALHQESVATIEERLAGRVLLYTDCSAPCSSLMRAFEALLEFFGDAALIARL
ncbi:hypothetical protein MRX96_037586 [Rhipicephalus microplus]